MKKFIVKQCILLFLTLTFLLTAASYSESAPELPEKFLYYVFWSGIRAGTATLEFIDTGKNTTITSHAESASLISLFYKVNDMSQSTVDEEGYPVSYTLKVEEGRHRRNKETTFEPGAIKGTQKIFYKNIRTKESAEFDLAIKAYDPLSALYETRKRPLIVGQNEYLDIFDNKKLWKTEVQVLKREKILVPAGEFDTILVKPLLKSEGIFMKKGDIYIWLSDDERRIPVMIMSKSKIGSFKVKLVKSTY